MTTVVDEKLATYREYQSKLQNLYSQKQQSLSQYNENTLVKGELDRLVETDDVFKLVGPALMKVDKDEANDNVAKRLEYIEAELKKLENQIAIVQKLSNDMGEEISGLQQQMQQDAAEAAKKVIADA